MIRITGFGVAVVLGTAVGLHNRAARRPVLPMATLPESVATREVSVLNIALGNFANDCRRYPDATEGLVALLNNPGLFDWHGPYVSLLRKDPWAHDYVYKVSPGTNEATAFSAGPDGIEGTADDIHVASVGSNQAN